MRKRLVSFVAVLACALLGASSASASKVWAWHLSGAGIFASGTLTTNDTPNSSGAWLITGVTGLRNGERIAALQPTGTAVPGNEGFPVDNLLLSGAVRKLTGSGFGFRTVTGTYSNPFGTDPGASSAYLVFSSSQNGQTTSELPVSFSVTPTPEPATVVLLLSSLPFVFRRAYPGWLSRSVRALRADRG